MVNIRDMAKINHEEYDPLNCLLAQQIMEADRERLEMRKKRREKRWQNAIAISGVVLAALSLLWMILTHFGII